MSNERMSNERAIEIIEKLIKDERACEDVCCYFEEEEFEALNLALYNMQNKEIIYYSIVNTTSDRTRGETGRYKTYEEAKEDLKNHCDWYREKGTGTIYEITEKLDRTELGFKITRTRKQMLKK